MFTSSEVKGGAAYEKWGPLSFSGVHEMCVIQSAFLLISCLLQVWFLTWTQAVLSRNKQLKGREIQAASIISGHVLQVFTLLWIADWMVHRFWRKGKDPDSFSIPYLTALGDLLGTALLALSFHFLWLIGDRDGDVGD